jgi:hypothetical protein
MTAPLHAGSKRPLALGLHDPDAAAEKRANTGTGATAPFVPSSVTNAVPLSAVAPKLAPEVRAEPPWLRTELLRYLRLRMDLPVHFIAEKAVTATDLVSDQNRFRIPNEGVMRNLRPMLTPLERKAANLLEEVAPRPPRLPKPLTCPGEKAVRRKRKGKKHGGLPVLVVGLHAGVRELQLSRWESSGVTIIKGEGYVNFISNSGFVAGDTVEIWVFKETHFRLFGVDVCHESPLFVLIIKKGEMLPGRN